MTDNQTTGLREMLNMLIRELDRLDIALDAPASNMTLGEYEQEREKLLDGFTQTIAATLGSGTSSSEAANPQVRCTDSAGNNYKPSNEDSHTLLPCPFCGGNARLTVWTPTAASISCIMCGAHFNTYTEAEAIEAWNTRACGQCEGGAVPMTEENMAAHGWFTREDVEGAFVSGYSLGSLPIGSDPRWNENEQTVDEHMAELGWVRERTCRLVGTLYYDGYDVWYHELSCGHEVETLDKEPPSYCPDCGAEVMDA